MENKHLENEKGQALVLIVIAMVALLGITALAIDGGMIYADRRFAQNAADTSSLAGAAAVALYLENNQIFSKGWNCSNPLIVAAQNANDGAKAAAINRADDNGFEIQRDVPINGVMTLCGQIDKISWVETYIDITTTITMSTQTSFAHFVYNGPVVNQVTAVSRVQPPRPLAFGNAIVAVNEAACSGNKNGVIFSGSANDIVNGGGVFSNGCLYGNGNKFSLTVNSGTVNYVGTANGTLTHITPAPQKVPLSIPESSYLIAPPNCTGLPDMGAVTSGGTISEGIYSKIKLTNGELTLNPGLYCVTGKPDALNITGGTLIGSGVTIFVTQGNISISGNAGVNLESPIRGSNPDRALEGILIYLPKGNTSEVNLEGNSTSAYLGTILAPDGDIKISGANNTTPTFNTQLIANNVVVSGNTYLQINFDDYHNAILHATMELLR
jgi:hypothetical protein